MPHEQHGAVPTACGGRRPARNPEIAGNLLPPQFRPIDLASMLRCLLSLLAVLPSPLAGRAAGWLASHLGLSRGLRRGLSWGLSRAPTCKEADGSSAGLPAAQRLRGVEVNLLGFSFGIDWRRPAPKLPGCGRVGGNAGADKTPVRRIALRRGLG